MEPLSIGNSDGELDNIHHFDLAELAVDIKTHIRVFPHADWYSQGVIEEPLSIGHSGEEIENIHILSLLNLQ